MAEASTSSSQRPDAKTQRYDRQLRLWASAGQTALEKASILVVNGTATASQVLKNLVLPGIGSFTILDDKIVDATDMGNNFFLTSDSIGQPRAQVSVELLKELNDGVQGKALLSNISEFLRLSGSSIADYSLVIACDTCPQDGATLAKQCWDLDVPLLQVRSMGFTGYVRSQVKEACFVETHPDSLVDLRLDQPFPALREYAMSLDVPNMDSMEFGHIPSVVIVIRALEEFKQKHGRSLASFSDRKELKQMILDQKRSLDDENHDEAVRLLVKLAKPTSVPNELSNLFKDPACTDLTTASSPFWILLRAVKDFVDADPNHLLPLTGSLPDMKATSKGYLKLSQLYRSKAQQDLSVVTQTVQSLLTDLGMPPDSIPPSDILSFVKHAAYIQVIRGTSYDDELLGNAPGKKSAERLQQEMDSDEESLLPWLVALRAAERFQLDNGRFPGDSKEHYDADVQNLPASARKILAPYGVSTQELPERVINACKEITRAGNAQLPQISALMGGIVAQEAIKLVTKQYVALNGNLVFDGIASKTAAVSF